MQGLSASLHEANSISHGLLSRMTVFGGTCVELSATTQLSQLDIYIQDNCLSVPCGFGKR